MTDKNPYRESGVDTEGAGKLVDWLKGSSPKPRSSISPKNFGSPLGGLGGFAACFQPDFSSLKEPVIVSCTDGIGTKLLLGIQTRKLVGLGQDLAGMCLNDLYTMGATPLFFLDYFATGTLDHEQFKDVVGGLKGVLDAVNCSLVGGETAELPGLYEKGHFDMAGFVVGVCDKQNLPDISNVKEGDKLIAIPSSGFHSNGYSLLRKWLAEHKALQSSKFHDFLMEPTKIYSFLPDLIGKFSNEIHGVSHITGGGFDENLPRIMQSDLSAKINLSHLQTPKLMSEIFEITGYDVQKLTNVFNLGVGVVIACDEGSESQIIEECSSWGAYSIGEVIQKKTSSESVVYV